MRTLLVLSVAVLSAGCAAKDPYAFSSNDGEPRPFFCGTGDGIPDIVMGGFRNTSGLAQAPAVLRRTLVRDLESSGLVVVEDPKTMSDFERRQSRELATWVTGEITEYAERDGRAILRGSLRVEGRGFDSRWTWEASVAAPKGPRAVPPIDSLAREVAIKTRQQGRWKQR